MPVAVVETRKPARSPKFLPDPTVMLRGVAANTAETAFLPMAVLESGLASALETLPTPAFVFGEDGLVRRANRASAAFFADDTRELLEAIAEDPTQMVREVTLRLRRGRYVVTRLSRVIAPCIYLAVCRRSEDELEARLDIFGDRWRLSTRQCETLEFLVQGLSNKAIAARLGIALGTAEIHVSKLLRLAGVASRAALTAKFFAESLA